MIAGLEILNLHAQGGMAEVYRARGKGADGTDYLYAVKRILPEYTRDPEIKKMFIEESRVAACLVHPNVVRVYDLATSEDEDLYIVMEFLEGKDLSEAIEEAGTKKKSLPIWFALQIAKEVLRALHYVTTQAVDRNGRILGLIHRDISPHNIFVCFDGQVKLTDFGVAKVQESNVKTQVGITKGKLGYMSPEQLMGSPLDPRSDLYNVGILLFEMITGKQLFGGGTTAEFLQAMVRGIVPTMAPALQVPPELEALIRRSLDRDRNKRPATALEFERELDQVTQAYNLVAQPAHVSHHVKELYGKLEAPKPMKPATAPAKLKSMMLQALSGPNPGQQAPFQGQQGPHAGQHGQHGAQAQQQQQQWQSSNPTYNQPAAQHANQQYNQQQHQQPASQQQSAWNGGDQAYPGEDEHATIVRPPEPRPPSTPRVDARVPQAPQPPQARVPSQPQHAQQGRVSSRPSVPLPPDAPSQPRVQVAVSTRMRTLDGPPVRSTQPHPSHAQQGQMPPSPAQQQPAQAWSPPPTAPIASVDDTPASPSSVFDSPTNAEQRVPTFSTARPTSQPISAENRRPATVARGNARPLEAPPSAPRPTQQPSPPLAQQPQHQQHGRAPTPATPRAVPADQWGENTDRPGAPPPDDNATRVEVNPLLRAPQAQPAVPVQPAPVVTPPTSPPPRAPTVTVGNSAVGVRSKKVVPLDDNRKR